MLSITINHENLKELCCFHKRIHDLGINGITQESFITQLEQFLETSYISFGYKQEKEKISIAEKIVVADVRQNPYIKRGFRPNDLTEILEANEMGYIRYNHLGNPKYQQDIKEKNFKPAKRRYQAYILTNENAKSDFEALYHQLHLNQMICLICYCQTEECHRKWLIEVLKIKKRVELKKKRLNQ